MVIHLAARVGGIGANRENPATFFYDNASYLTSPQPPLPTVCATRWIGICSRVWYKTGML
jgi:hypothetical protein